MTEFLIELMRQFNEAITAATVIVAASLLLYNLTRNQRDRVIRSSSALLACVTLISVGDVFVALAKTQGSMENWLRFEWIGMAIAPAALFHLSDALLATTGLVSRGRRRRIVKILYLYSIVFMLAAALTDLMVHNLIISPLPMMQSGSLFFLYVVYFITATIFAFNNVLRARRRCLTRATHRRMSYLLFSLVTPALGIFPYSLLFSQPGRSDSLILWVLINVSNLSVVLMLAFMSYPLAFFGVNKPDRVIKAELLNFMLRGPIIGILVLLVILWVPRLQTFGVPISDLTPFFAVAMVLCAQWLFTVIMPFLERRLIYTKDQEQARQIQDLSRHLRTPADSRQLIEAILAAICDQLRVSTAFVASQTNGDPLHYEQVVGSLIPPVGELGSMDMSALATGSASLKALVPTTLSGAAISTSSNDVINEVELHPTANYSAISELTVTTWKSFWIFPLFSDRPNRLGMLVGVLGIWARAEEFNLDEDEISIFGKLLHRASLVVDDMKIQEEVFTSLKDVIISANETGKTATDATGYKSGKALSPVDNPEFSELIRDALRDLWGGPRLTDERLLSLSAVKRALNENDNNPAKAVRAVISQAIEKMKPEGMRNMVASEWTLYNILDLRFVQGRKVRDVARQLVMSDADFYRKQKIAIDHLARTIAEEN